MTWLDIWNNYINLAPGIGQIALRLGFAMVIGIIIGLEREFTHRPAGLRTHILVVLGACVVSILGEMLFTHYHALGSSADPARLSAQVITGVGFLGAGTIMKEGVNVKGLTTAASVWAVACLGLACGFGYYVPALLGMVFIMITLTVLEALQRRLIPDHNSDLHYLLETTDLSASMAFINEQALANTAVLFDMGATQTEGGYRITFRVHFSGRRCNLHQLRFFEAVAAHPASTHFHPVETRSGTAV
ncbi:MAG: MgtC/SapB family protein [Ruminococcaceae bacterium]|nr:MgtC/SapB family protein [Oscillospiraceae bacterium]